MSMQEGLVSLTPSIPETTLALWSEPVRRDQKLVNEEHFVSE